MHIWWSSKRGEGGNDHTRAAAAGGWGVCVLNRRGCAHTVVKQEGTRRRLLGRTK